MWFTRPLKRHHLGQVDFVCGTVRRAASGLKEFDTFTGTRGPLPPSAHCDALDAHVGATKAPLHCASSPTWCKVCVRVQKCLQTGVSRRLSRLTSVQIVISRFVSSSPTSGSLLSACQPQACFKFSVPPSLPLPCLRSSNNKKTVWDTRH